MNRFSLRILIKRIVMFCLVRIYGSKSDIVELLSNNPDNNIFYDKNIFTHSKKSQTTKIYPKYVVRDSHIQDYTYISQNAIIQNAHIGKFCSIGPNLIAGWGIHPTDGISTAPMFYSTRKQNGFTLSHRDKLKEMKSISIGNDVFIGMNVTILDGITIGDGVVIGAGSVVTKDVPAYAIVGGNPAKIIRFRFSEDVIQQLLEIKWWNWDQEKLKDVEMHFFDIAKFIDIHGKNNHQNKE